MSSPIVMPDELGAPCWSRDRVDQFISTVARVDASQAASFLASHTPVLGVNTDRGRLTETEIFEALIGSRKLERLIAVTGEPGSGKSHLINWLKLRLDDALLTGEHENIRSVLIKRRTGSLRDALEQLIEQLPDFAKYLDPVKAAIDNLNAESAKRELCFKLSQLLHERPSSDRRLRNLHDYFSDPGSLRWLCRDGGAIDRNVQRLIAKSDSGDRESIPPLDKADFLISDQGCFRLAGPSVLELQDVVVDEVKLALALSHVNAHMRAAVERLTGLGNQTLHQILSKIRKELRERGQSLALFIEDVSTLSALDVEVVNALEPQNDQSLCRLFSVLGMTQQALKRLPANMRDRIDLALEIEGSEASSALKTDAEYSDNFVARYLNSIRLSDENIGRVAEGRRRGGDVSISACDGCGVRDRCFGEFGSVELADAKIGLFPFRRGSAQRLITGLRDDGPIKKNPRGLLEHIVSPVLTAISKGLTNAPVNLGMPVEPMPPTDLDSASQRYLGGWDERSKQRLSFLVWYWAGHKSCADGLGELDIFRKSFGLPRLSQAPQAPPRGNASQNQDLPKPNARSSVEPTVAVSPEYERLTRTLDKWIIGGEKLENDAKFRELLLPLLKQSIPWGESRTPAEPAKRRIAELKTSSIEITGMKSQPAVGAAMKFQLPRSEETAQLLRALLGFKYKGSSSWKYDGSVADKRNVGRWARKWTADFLKVPDPPMISPDLAWEAGVRYLILAYQLSMQKPLPNDYSEVVGELFGFQLSTVASKSTQLEQISRDLTTRVPAVREFLYNELDVPQGQGSILFIDPLPVIRAVEKIGDDISQVLISDVFQESFWATRFKAISDLQRNGLTEVEAALDAERFEILKSYGGVVAEMSKWDLGEMTSPAMIEAFVDSAKGIRAALKATKQSVGSDEAESILSRNDNPIAKWSRVLKDAEALQSDENRVSTLRFKMSDLTDLSSAVQLLATWLGETERLINEKYSSGTNGLDLNDEVKKAIEAIDGFDAVVAKSKEE